MDYNSNDGLEDWIREELFEEIISGKVVFYRTNDPLYFQRSHSRNMAFILASGEVVCNVDADNYIGAGFAQYLAMIFSAEKNIFISCGSFKNNAKTDYLGRISCLKSDFLTVGGFDELMEGYGFEDLDLIARLKALGLKPLYFEDLKFFYAVPHSDEERISQERLANELVAIHIAHISPTKTDILYLYKDEKFEMGRLMDCVMLYSKQLRYAIRPKATLYEYEIIPKTWDKGIWQRTGEILELSFSNGKSMAFKSDYNGTLSAPKKNFIPVTNKEILTMLIMFHSQYTNRLQMHQNRVEPRNLLNNVVIGKGKVFKNFTDTPISVRFESV